MLASVTSATTGDETVVVRDQSYAFVVSIAGTGAVSAEYDIQASGDGTNWRSVATGSIRGTTSAADSFVITAPSARMRAVCTAISGTDAALTVRVPVLTLVNAVVADTLLNVTLGQSALADDATDGFAYIPVVADTPTGEPTAKTGFAPMCVDADGTKLWVYIGDAWKSTTVAAPE